MGIRTTEDLSSFAPGLGAAHSSDAFRAAIGLFDAATAFAPHVLMRLLEHVEGDVDAAHEYAAHLSTAQRRGFQRLPERLPDVEAIAIVGRWHDLEPAESDILLMASLAIDPDIVVLAHAAQRSMVDLVDGPVGVHLDLACGRYTFADARLAIVVQNRASASDHASAHSRLEAAFHALGHQDFAAWHATEAPGGYGDDWGRVLLDAARRRSGDAYAQRFAERAIAHTQGAERIAAATLAGTLAMHAGYLDDAIGIFTEAAAVGRSGGGGTAAEIELIGQLLVAQTIAEGAPPVRDPTLHRPRSDDADQWRSWAHAAGLTAVLCAERGLRSESRLWLSEVREADRRAGAEGTLRDPAVALCGLLSGEQPADDAFDRSTELGVIFHALQDALGGDTDAGLRRLVAGYGPLSTGTDALIGSGTTSALVSAYRSVLEALLRFWRGDAVEARRVLLAASTTLPVALPFAGVGVVLARRLDLVIDGALGAFSLAMTAALPPATPLDLQIDRAIEFYLAGRIDAAAVEVRLWLDKGAQHTALYVPGLEELVPERVSSGVGPPDHARASELLRRIRSSQGRNWPIEEPRLTDEARGIRSAFARARVESALGIQSAIRGDRSAAQQHLLAARSLFGDAGATAWGAAVENRLAGLSERWQAPGMPIAVIEIGDPLTLCRVAWADSLTPRELDAAMLVVDGHSNREISTRLRVSIRTVEVHLGRVFAKLGVRTRVELTVLAHRTGQHL